jgi:hypothetical protein
MTTCPCCSGVLLRHVRRDGVYWFCNHCWQEMPDFSLISCVHHRSMPSLPQVINELMPTQQLAVSR